jgi:hypothetical protein
MTETDLKQDDTRTLLMRRTAEMAAIFMVGDGMLQLSAGLALAARQRRR